MGLPLRYARGKGNVVALLASVLLIGFIGFLLASNYSSQKKIREAALKQLHLDINNRAAAVSYFFSERRNDLTELTGNRAISAFFENEALGMSMEYGLKASLIAISEEFGRLLNQREIEENQIYTRMVLIDHTGKLLVERAADPDDHLQEDWKSLLTPEKHGPAITATHNQRLMRITVSVPYFFKNEYAGQIAAWISPQAVNHFLGSSKKFSIGPVSLVCSKHAIITSPVSQYGAAALNQPEFSKIEPNKPCRFDMVHKDGTKVDEVAILASVKDTPLSLLALRPAAELFGGMVPWHLPLTLGILAIVLLGVTATVHRANTQNLVLQARLEESAEKQQEIEEKKHQLEKEIAFRKVVEAKLRKAHEKLEQRVQERTSELAKANEELLGEIAERKRAGVALEESERKYRNVVERANDGIVIIQDGSIKFINHRMAESIGYSVEDVIGKDFADYLHPKEVSRLKKVYRLRMTGKPVDPRYETILKHRDGTDIRVEINAGLIDYDGEAADLVIVRDITNRKRAEEERISLETQLRQAQKMEALGTLAGGIAHDFNNILTAIIGYAQLVHMNMPEGKAQKNLKQVLMAGNRARDLVKQIITFSRQTEQQRRPVNISPIIKETLKMLRASLPTTIEIRQDIENNLGAVIADPTQIHQVAMNLCSNAGYAMREDGGTLAVSLTETEITGKVVTQNGSALQPGRYLRLTVSDTGPGIEPPVVERIFEPYFTTKEKGEGTGLGLAVVHGIVKAHGGSIQVQSERGKGSTFVVYLPKADAELGKETEKGMGPLPTGNERILFVDDEKPVVDLGRQFLQHLGYEVVARTSSIEALEAFRTSPDAFDLVITDMTMPNMTGDRLAKEILRIRPDCPIILCTGFSEKISEASAKKIGIRVFLMKPLVLDQLAWTVRSALEGPGSEQEALKHTDSFTLLNTKASIFNKGRSGL
jgi:PAS domain S-box-containing protein